MTMKQLNHSSTGDIINMADWLASQQTDDNSAVPVAFSEKRRLSRRKPEKAGCLKLTQAQRETTLEYAPLPDELVTRLMIAGQRSSRFSVEELNVLQE